jgi:Phosphoglucose isomerase
LSGLDAAIEFHFAILMASSSLWQRFQRYFLDYPDLGFSLDVGRMKFPDDLFEKMRRQIEHAFAAMQELEAAAIANPTENRMVGHYWLRSPAVAPTAAIRSEIEDTIRRIKAFAQDVHIGKASIPEVNAFYIGALIALYERAVGFYGSLVNIDAYDQPGVEAGKKAASKLLQLQKQVRAHLSGGSKTAEEIARSVDADPEDVFHLLRHLASNDPRIKVATCDEPADDRFSLGQSK